MWGKLTISVRNGASLPTAGQSKVSRRSDEEGGFILRKNKKRMMFRKKVKYSYDMNKQIQKQRSQEKIGDFTIIVYFSENWRKLI